jgi:hypothetical protein
MIRLPDGAEFPYRTLPIKASVFRKGKLVKVAFKWESIWLIPE